MTRIAISSKSTELLRSEAMEQYGPWSSTRTYTICSVRMGSSNPTSYEETFEVGAIAVGDTVHVLSVIYSSGDSFGCSTGNGEIIMVYKRRDLAEQAYSIYDEKSDEDIITLPVETPDGVVFHDFGNVASGYFEKLSSINLDTFVVEIARD